jgi:hypothetical protein
MGSETILDSRAAKIQGHGYEERAEVASSRKGRHLNLFDKVIVAIFPSSVQKRYGSIWYAEGTISLA